jgi:hypothetical protein
MFGKSTMKIRYFWEIHNKNMGNLPLYGNIAMEIGTLGKSPFLLYMEICP